MWNDKVLFFKIFFKNKKFINLNWLILWKKIEIMCMDGEDGYLVNCGLLNYKIID